MAYRQFVSPEPGEDLVAIAARVLPSVPEGPELLQSWNLHLAVRIGASRSIGLLPSDIVFTEPPPP